MKRATGNAGKILCAILYLAGIFLFTASVTFADESGTGSITGSFYAFGHTVSREYAYSEDFFRLPRDEYNHDMARLSLGLALAAFRDTGNPDAHDDTLIAYFEEMGFEQIETGTSLTEPSSFPISYGFARLPLEDMTVVALAVCGGNYGDEEWASNLTVGDDVRSEGFQACAVKVEEALADYMERHPAEGDVKLWIAGFSRGAAVSNITAADCTDSGVYKDVYAYTFATPRTTREPGQYTNIFNILRKNDVVPKIPLADWEFKRFGTDMYLVSPEIDIDRADVFARAKELYQEMIGSDMVVNFDLNYQLRTLFDYLYMLMQDSGTYVEYLQPIFLDLLTKSDGTMDALTFLLEAIQQYSQEDNQHEEELQSLVKYLESLIGVYVLQDGISKLPIDKWDPQYGTYNLFNEHFPFDYQALMLSSDDPEELFSNNTKYARIVIYGKVETQIMEGDKVLKTVLKDGKELVDGVEDPESLPHVEYANNKRVITLPADRSFTISIKSKAILPQTITYTGLVFSGDTVRAEADDQYSFLMNSGDTASIKTSTGGKAIEPEGSDYTEITAIVDKIYSPTTVMRLENNRVIHLTITGLVNKILFILILLILSMIVSIILTIIRIKKHKKRHVRVALIWHCVIAAVFAILEVSMWYFVPILTLAKFIPGLLVFIVITVYIHKGYRLYKKNLKACVALLAALAAYVILESLLIGDFAIWKGIMLMLVYAFFLTAGYIFLWKEKGEVCESAS